MSMLRTISRNVGLALAITLPSLIVAAGFVTWLVDPSWWARRLPASPADIAGGFLFWYVILALPVLGFALVHQLVVIGLTHQWPRAAGRTLTIGVSLALGALIALSFGVTSTDPHALVYAAAWLIVAGCYGIVARPYSIPTHLEAAG